MGVWIEISFSVFGFLMYMSRPSWACGLKYGRPAAGSGRHGSRPSWACGLKFGPLDGQVELGVVTPLVGVWIEIPAPEAGERASYVTPLVGVWIEILWCDRFFLAGACHAPRGRVD